MTGVRDQRQQLIRLAVAALAGCLASQSAAESADVLLRCTTGPGRLSGPVTGELPAEEALVVRVSGDEWREWSAEEERWSVDLCARRGTVCELTALRLVRIATFPGDGQTVTLERSIERRTGSYRKRITTTGRNPHVTQWEGACEAVEKPVHDATPAAPAR